MGELATYELVHFLPFSLDTYIRLFARWNESLWPVQMIALLIGLGAVGALAAGRTRLGVAAVAAGFCGSALFLGTDYSELVWAGPWMAGAMVVQAVALAVWAAREELEWTPSSAGVAGVAMVFCAFWPRLSGLEWANAEVFGLTPDGTAVVALTVVAASRSRWKWLLMPVPAGWLAISAATWWGLGDPGGAVIPGVGLGLCVAYSVRRAIW